jgi:hypothetical protein
MRLFAVAIVVALAVALRAPLHNVLELRYVTGRFAAVLSGRFLWLMLALISGIVVCRLAALFVGEPARIAEILVGYTVLAVGCFYKPRDSRESRRVQVVAAVVLPLALAASLRWPAYHFVVLAHLHNVVPLVFLWEWARRLPSVPARRWFRAAQVGWVLVVPALILTGVTDPLIGGVTSRVAAFAGNPTPILAASAPPAAVATTMGVRLLVVFAFLQSMHYFVWVYFLPRHAPDAAAAFAGRVPWLRGRRAWALGVGFGVLLAVLLVVDYTTGRALYASVASYHAYLEFPVLLVLLLGVPAGSQVVSRESAPDCQPVAAVS